MRDHLDIEELMRPGGIVPVDIPTTAGLVREVLRLRKGIQDYLDGNFGPKYASKHDKCPHGLFAWEDCGNCIDEYFVALLAFTPADRGEA